MYIILSLTHFYIAENGFIADCSFVRAVRAHYPSTVFGAFILMTTRLAAVFTELGGGVGGGLSVRQTNAHQERDSHSTAPPATASNTIIMFWRISTRRAAPRLCSHFQLLIIALQYILTASLLCSFTAAQTRVERRASERASSSDRRWPASY